MGDGFFRFIKSAITLVKGATTLSIKGQYMTLSIDDTHHKEGKYVTLSIKYKYMTLSIKY
jgi:hypothetical protein